MPYIPEAQRSALREDPFPVSGGGLNFTISALIDQFIGAKGLSYSTLNEVVGALECAKLELYRRIAAPYEDVKLAENGDVYTVAEN